mgnify:CR=1 FL=1
MSASIVFNFVATEELNVDNEGIVIPSTATSPNEPVSAISNLPNEPVDVDEPLTVPTEFMLLQTRMNLQKPHQPLLLYQKNLLLYTNH